MPTYEYECAACHATFERFQSITARPIRKCPRCGARKARRLIGSGAGILFRGSGFYQTDYRSEEYKTKAKAEGKATSAPKDSAPEKPSSAPKSTPAGDHGT